MSTLNEFKSSISASDQPSADLSRELQALWLDKAGHWEAAHEMVDSAPGQGAAWVHAYLHRVEGDEWNAGYWYDRARKTMPKHLTLDQEWEALVIHFLG